jgi:hypothetical protein
LLELGKGFAFVARQQRISTDSKDFYVDLIFYNYLLKCFVLFDLKTGEWNIRNRLDGYVRPHLRPSEAKSRGQPNWRHHPLRPKGCSRSEVLRASR